MTELKIFKKIIGAEIMDIAVSTILKKESLVIKTKENKEYILSIVNGKIFLQKFEEVKP